MRREYTSTGCRHLHVFKSLRPALEKVELFLGVPSSQKPLIQVPGQLETLRYFYVVNLEHVISAWSTRINVKRGFANQYIFLADSDPSVHPVVQVAFKSIHVSETGSMLNKINPEN